MPIIKHEPEFVEIDGHGKCEVLVVPKVAPNVQRKHYTKDSMTHPAKMDTMLCRAIIRRYTKEGELILDPMAGIGTTLVEASLLGRNVIGVELESKFVKICGENIRFLKKLKTPAKKGKAKIIQGDARFLSRVLGEKADLVFFSPPFERTLAKENPNRRKGYWNFKLGHRTDGYGEDKQNIGNLPYSVDAIVTSPPFERTLARENPYRRKGYWRGSGGYQSGRGTEGYGENKNNIGNLPHGRIDAVITSPPYSESMTKRRKGYTTHPQLSRIRHMGADSSDNNIANLPHGQVDAIFFSPPYAEQRKGKTDPEKMAKRWEEHRKEDWDYWGKSAHTLGRIRSFAAMGSGYSENDENIGNLPYQVDIIITSPPYSGSSPGGGDTRNRKRRLVKAGYNPKDFLGGLARNLVLKHYSDDPKNIGNLPHGQVDSIITSPPFESVLPFQDLEFMRKIGRRYDCEKMKNPNNIGNLKNETYLSAMFRVYAQCFKVLKPGGHMILVLKNFIRNKKIVRLDLDTKRLCETVGFEWVETKLFRLPNKSFWRILYEKKYPDVDTSLLKYEFIQVFKKPEEPQ